MKLIKNKSHHNKSGTRLYRIFENMLARCYRPSNKSYKYCGAKGITICDEWLKNKSKFFEWAENNGYNKNLTIDRIDNQKGYSPDNCRWVDRKTQDRNRTSNVFITYNGETLCRADWEKRLGFRLGLLKQRIDWLGWSIEKALTKPVKRRKQNGYV